MVDEYHSKTNAKPGGRTSSLYDLTQRGRKEHEILPRRLSRQPEELSYGGSLIFQT